MRNMEIEEALLYQMVGKSIKQRRKEVGMTQSQLATEVGVLRTSVTNIETGRQKAPLHLLFKLCAALGVETHNVIPENAEIVRPNVVPVEVDGEVQYIPPKAAEALKRLRAPESRRESS